MRPGEQRRPDRRADARLRRTLAKRFGFRAQIGIGEVADLARPCQIQRERRASPWPVGMAVDRLIGDVEPGTSVGARSVPRVRPSM